MTPAARVQAAIEIVVALDDTKQPADRFIRDWFRARHYAGSKDRATVAERVYDVFRHRASFAWRMGREDARALVIASLLSEGISAHGVGQLFTGGTYNPPPLSKAEERAIAAPPQIAPPQGILGDYPQWLEPELLRAFGASLMDEMQALVSRAPVDLRVNTLRASRTETLTGLQSLGVKAKAASIAPHGIRIASQQGLGSLRNTQYFETGAFEFQDESSQVAALLTAVQPGERVLDLAAGAGGKALAMAAEMQNRGEILAFDTDSVRLKQLAPRARRAGATIITATDKRGGPLWGNGTFDVVLVDTPCSGSGAWRRNPEAKWRLTPERLDELTRLQAWLIDDGARHVRPGGRLVYATCSILPRENEDVIDSFLARNAKFTAVAAKEIWRSLTGVAPLPAIDNYFRATPLKAGTDGFFTCIMVQS